MITALLRNKLFITVAFLLLVIISLFLSLTVTSRSSSAGAPTCTWTGAGGNTSFTTVGNWTCETGTVPVDGTTLIFPLGVTNRTANNNLAASVKFSGISFTGVCSGVSSTYNITGTVRMAGDITDTTTGTPDCLSNTSFGQVVLFSNSTLTTRTNMLLNSGLDTSTAFNFTVAEGAGSYGGRINLASTVAGSGQIIAVNSATILLHNVNTAATGFTGSWVANTGGLIGISVTSATNNIGSRPITVGDTARLYYNIDSAVNTFSVANPVTISGTAYSGPRSGFNGMDAARVGVYFNSTEVDDLFGVLGSHTEYHYWNLSGKTFTFSGALTLQSNLVMASTGQVTFSGAISGAGNTITRYATGTSYYESGAPIVVTGSSNTSATSNATYSQTLRTSTFGLGTCAGVGSPQNVFVGRLNRVIVNGTCATMLLRFGGILSGAGTVGAVTVQSSKVAPGNSPGILNTGNISFDSGSSLDEEIGGTNSGEFDQLNVTGTVTLGNATLNLTHYNSFIPQLGDSFIIVNNDASDAISGTFAGKAQGSTIVADNVTYTISYVGGTGNDVVLTVLSLPGAPNTAGVLAKPVNIAIAGAVVMLGIGTLFVRKSYLKSSRRAVRTRK